MLPARENRLSLILKSDRCYQTPAPADKETREPLAMPSPGGIRETFGPAPISAHLRKFAERDGGCKT